ncbi:hypothetical protein E4H04_05305 [Candidatus Bathyarchaeota archaeon]|jgi:hypothetical protein|nr:MAG: hypothetical protein E4H04_05305 [Candidatus Bathyarchaeota archaeon]
MSALFQTSGFIVGGTAVFGLLWWIKSIYDSYSLIDISIEKTQEDMNVDTSKLKLVEIGTGQKAERTLGASLANSTGQTVFLAGAITKTVYNLLRDWLPQRASLNVLVNPIWADQILLNEIKNRYANSVRETDELTSGGVTVFKIGADSLFMLLKENNAIVMTTDPETISILNSKNNDYWSRAKPYR